MSENHKYLNKRMYPEGLDKLYKLSGVATGCTTGEKSMNDVGPRRPLCSAYTSPEFFLI